MSALIDAKSILITGGTGSFGQHMAERLARTQPDVRIVIFSRDELKQDEMRRRLSAAGLTAIRYFLGDVRDKDRLYRAFDGVDVVVHAAALKQVPAAEYNPMEAIKTNVLGAANVIDAALDCDVKKVIALSTDKAAMPANLYGATKLCSDKLFIAARSYATRDQTRFAVVRYGNVIDSRGSVVPLFLQQRAEGKLTVTDERMTRFMITLPQGVDFVLKSLRQMRGGEIFIPRLPSVRVVDLAEAMAPGVKQERIGIRPGEKLHETMLPEYDARNTFDMGDYFVVLPTEPGQSEEHKDFLAKGKRCPEDLRYSSDTNTIFLTPPQIRDLLIEAGVLL